MRYYEVISASLEASNLPGSGEGNTTIVPPGNMVRCDGNKKLLDCFIFKDRKMDAIPE